MILDVGCGPGHLAHHLSTLSADVLGIDLLPEFIHHATATHPEGRYLRGSAEQLPIADQCAAGILAWFSLIHLTPDDLDPALAELGRVVATGGPLVIGCFDADELGPFDHAVATAYRWPAGELSARLQRAGFEEVERIQRPGVDRAGARPHAAIAAIRARPRG